MWGEALGACTGPTDQLFFNIHSVQLLPLITPTSSLHRYSAENVHQNEGKTSYLNALSWLSSGLGVVSVRFYTGQSVWVQKVTAYLSFVCAVGVNNSNVGLHKHVLARTSVSICCSFHGDFLSSVCVEAERTWPLFLCRCQRSSSALSTDAESASFLSGSRQHC